jgi:hypothetical protein
VSGIERRNAAPVDPAVTRSVLGPDHSTYALDTGVVVATVRGASVQLFDGFGLYDVLACETPEQAERAALDYAYWWLRPPAEAGP